jgi:sigma-B regulation protein RsbU (phosphoserine phosphatase)
MDTLSQTTLRTQLLDRRLRLEDAMTRYQENSNIACLLREVDSALERMDSGTYGLCDLCHEPIEQDWLRADPLVRICLAHLTPEQQRAFEQDLDLASQIQGALLPKPSVAFEGWDICTHYEPAGPVSGDYCDLVYSENGRKDLFFLLGDISGKGVAASLLMSHLHAIFRSLIALEMPVARLVERANRVFCESTLSTQFATLICGKASSSGEIELCNAGHCPPLLVRGAEVSPIEATGLPVGIFCGGQYSHTEIRLAEGESLILYTDGLTEAQNESNTEYSVTRLTHVVANPPPSARTLAAACLEDLRSFQSGKGRTDDLSIMVIRRAG